MQMWASKCHQFCVHTQGQKKTSRPVLSRMQSKKPPPPLAAYVLNECPLSKVWSYNIICLIWTVHLMLGQTLPTQILRQIAKFPAGRIAFDRVWSHNIIWIKALCVCSTKWDSHGAWLVYVLAVNQITYTFGGSMGDGVVGIQLPYLFLSEAICHD